MAYALVVRMRTRDGEQRRAQELMRELVPASRAEPGCNQYIAHRDPEDDRVFLMYEQYRDKSAFEEHGQTEHFQRLAAGELFGLMEERDRRFYETLD
ncbi:MAG: antibiotic biosynthesis monooxygenase [Solirubrobacterales bacterium]|nr:antibiotic biosynthesis monooxygenase [Solirubrobacterales bacterium]